MIDTTKENEQLNILLHKKNVLQNISYKLSKDANIIFKKIRKTLKNFFEVLFQEYGDIEIEKIIKCCNIFPDNIGKRIIMQISYIFLLDGFIHRINYEENKKNYMDKELIDIISSNKRKNDFTDYEKKNVWLLQQIKKYEENKEEIETAIKILIKNYKEAKDLDELKIELAKKVWNNEIEKKENFIKKFKNIINEIIKDEK